MIILPIVMFITALIVLLSVYGAHKTGANPNGNTLLGISLPNEVLENDAVTGIAQKYRRANNLLGLIFFALSLPLIFITYASISFIYMLAWGVAVFGLYGAVLNKHYDKLATLKAEKKWWVGECRIISVDTEVSRLKDLFPVSKTWYLIPLLIGTFIITFLVVTKSDDVLLWGIAFSGLAVIFTIFILSRVIDKGRTKVYSDNSEVNLTLNRLYKRVWSQCWLAIAILNSAINAAFCWTQLIIGYNAAVLVGYILLLSVSTLVLLFLAHNKICTERNRLLLIANEDSYTDDDPYWYRGSYCNPNDNRWWVEKRIGIGMTINEGKRGAKLIIYTSYGLVILLFLGFAVYLLPHDFSSF
jgi:uncharacterized membrane protein